MIVVLRTKAKIIRELEPAAAIHENVCGFDKGVLPELLGDLYLVDIISHEQPPSYHWIFFEIRICLSAKPSSFVTPWAQVPFGPSIKNILYQKGLH